jgi:short-subunit dehydrogenase
MMQSAGLTRTHAPREARVILEDKTAIVTGASSGIGEAVAVELARAGCHVVLIGRDGDRLAVVRESLAGEGHFTFICDFDTGQELDALIEVLTGLPTVDILVHAAGIITLGSHSEKSVDSLDAMYRVNLHAPVLLTAALLPKLIAAKGTVAFINSSAALAPGRRNARYAATKAGLKAYADSLRQEVNADGVRVLSVFPGSTATPMQKRLGNSNPHAMINASAIAQLLLGALVLDQSAELTDIHVRPMRKA